jgi:drug/metabolite transporter (DMT)-like permease
MPNAPAPAAKPQTVMIALAFLALYIIWGTTYLAIAIAVESIPPFFMAGIRFFIAGSLALIYLRLRGVPLPNRRQWGWAAVIGGFLLLGGNGILAWAEQRVPTGLAAVIIATVPLWITLMDWLLFKGLAPTRRIVLGLALGLAGIILLVGPAQLQVTAAFSLTDLLILLLSPLLWAFGSLLSRRANLPANVFMATAAEMLAAGLLLVLTALLLGETAGFDPAAVTTRSWLAVLYLVVFGSFIGLTAYIWLLTKVEAVKVASYAYVNPVIAVFLGWLILAEELTLLMGLAAAVIIAAVVLITARRPRPRPSRRRRQPAAPAGD